MRSIKVQLRLLSFVAAVLSAMLLSRQAVPAAEQVLVRFAGSYDVVSPDGPLLAARGAFYGASAYGGQHALGSIFELKPPSRAGGEWSHSVIYSFSGTDGVSPSGHLLYWRGAIYGTTASYAAPAAGTVYRLTPGPTGWSYEKLFEFAQYPQDGGTPRDGVIAVGEDLYGTCASAYPYFAGSVFKLSPPTGAGGKWREFPIHVFSGGTDGENPISGVVHLNGAFYGTTSFGGASNEGAVYQLIPHRGHWEMSTIYSFEGEGDGAQPDAIVAAGGALYGTAFGGNKGFGTVFSEQPINGGWSFGVMHQFSGGTDGSAPSGSSVLLDGTLFGTTSSGGASGFGTVFSIEQYSIKRTLYDFAGGPADGANPLGGLLPFRGRLIGVTAAGGANNQGTVFAVGR